MFDFIVRTKKAKPMTDEEYYSEFNSEKQMEEAYKKSWELRLFENKTYWTRTLYFGGFTSVIFVAYTKVLGLENLDKDIEFYLILLGLVFSFAWYLSNIASKSYIDNWIRHIEKLESKISGDLCKIYYYKKCVFTNYSVTRINQFMVLVIMAFWGILLIKTVNENYGSVVLIIPILMFSFLIFFCRSPQNIYTENTDGFVNKTKAQQKESQNEQAN